MDVNKGEPIKNPGITYDADMRLTEAAAAAVFMRREREKRGFDTSEETDFASFSKRWNEMVEDERERFAQRLADFAGRAATGPGPITGVPVNETPPVKATPLDYAVTLAKEEGLEPIKAGLAVVVAGAATKKKDEDIAPGTRKYFTVSQRDPDGTKSTVTIPIPQYDPGEVKGILTRMSQLNLSPAPALVSPLHP